MSDMLHIAAAKTKTTFILVWNDSEDQLDYCAEFLSHAPETHPDSSQVYSCDSTLRPAFHPSPTILAKEIWL